MAGQTQSTVKLYGFWVSPFSLRVEWALKLKGVEYEYIHEDLIKGKSQELLHYNPITKQIPVLLHGDKAIAESMVIVEYIDETWPDSYSILSKDSYDRAQARFWSKFIEDKCGPACYNVFLKTGEDMEKAVQDAQEKLRTLEEALRGKKFFGGENIGFLDIAAGWFPCWIRLFEELVGVNIVNNENLPLMNAWFDNFLGVELMKERLPPKDKLYAFNKARRERLLTGQSN